MAQREICRTFTRWNNHLTLPLHGDPRNCFRAEFYLEGIMRVLEKAEINEVSGGTFCLLGGLLSSLFSCFAPKAPTCAPAPVSCAPVKCAPVKKGCY
jgi:hypothetical protein